MELKDVILSTLAEMEEDVAQQPESKVEEKKQPLHVTQPKAAVQKGKDEEDFLNAIRERLLVLFEGFQAPNNANLEAKIDMTLNFLEYTLATIDERLEAIKKDNL